MLKRSDLEKINELVKLFEENLECVFLVEGKEDKYVLKMINEKLKIITVANKSLFSLEEKIRGKSVVILTDRDKEGTKMYKKIKEICEVNGCKENIKLRTKFFENLNVRCVEDAKRKLEEFITIYPDPLHKSY